MIKVTVETRFVHGQFDNLPTDLLKAIAEKVAEFTGKLWDKVVQEKLSGQVLQIRTGALARSIRSHVEDSGSTITGTVYSDGTAPYARILEYGGTTPPHDITPTKAQALHFLVGGKEVFAKVVHHPGSIMPPHSFMRSALAEMVPEIEAGFREVVASVLNAKAAA